MRTRFVLAIAASAALAAAAVGQDQAPMEAKPPAPDAPSVGPSVTDHTLRLADRTPEYTATASLRLLRDDEGEPTAEVFSVAYTLDGAEPAARPVTFVFNGGPGSSSVWLHMGAIGPKRVVMSDRGETLPPPGALADNEHSWLPMSDLVFIDPVGTGYSRPLGEATQEEFSGVRQDAESVAAFIRDWITENERWASPKFLAGESYGTTRSAAVAGVLLNEHHVALNGVFLISTILDFSTARFRPANNLPYALFLPTYTATAWFHGALPADLQRRELEDVLSEVETWALDTYLPALELGARLPEARSDRVAANLARYTGLDEAFVRQANLRVGIRRFTKELLRDERRSVGRLDSRFVGIDRDAAGETFEHDPSYTAIAAPYTAMLNDYVRTGLGFETERPYNILTSVGPWDWTSWGGENAFVNVAETLREVVSKNPFMLVHVFSGYYDLATPYFAADYTMDQMGLEPALRGNLSASYYEAGHMMYLRAEALAKMQREARRVYEASAAQTGPAPPISMDRENR